MRRIEDGLNSCPNSCLSPKHEPSPKFAPRISMFPHQNRHLWGMPHHFWIHFEISWSNKRPPVPGAHSSRPKPKAFLCWIYSCLGYSRRGWGLPFSHQTCEDDIANRNHSEIVLMHVHSCSKWQIVLEESVTGEIWHCAGSLILRNASAFAVLLGQCTGSMRGSFKMIVRSD